VSMGSVNGHAWGKGEPADEADRDRHPGRRLMGAESTE
jgi:hypothetical protein